MVNLEELHAHVAALDTQLRDLRLELARAAVGGFRSMRDTRRCPACGGQKLLHIPQAKEMTHGGAVPLSVHHQDAFWGPKGRGPIEHFVCRTCYLIESHAITLEGVEPDGKTVIAIDPDPDAPADGPFR